MHKLANIDYKYIVVRSKIETSRWFIVIFLYCLNYSEEPDGSMDHWHDSLLQFET